MSVETTDTNLLELATELTIAWLANPNTRASGEDVPAFLEKMHSAVTGLAAPTPQAETAEPVSEFAPAVSVRRSLASKDHILSMIDGKPYKSLKRHLSGHGLTPAQYRERYGLKSDYPMVSENYASMRRDLAKKIGLGRKPGARSTAAAPSANSETAPAKPKAGRRKKVTEGEGTPQS